MVRLLAEALRDRPAAKAAVQAGKWFGSD